MGFIHNSAVIDQGVKIGNNVSIWHFSHILKGSEIGDNCSIGQNVMIGPNVKIGSDCKIQNNVSIYSGVEIEDKVFCGPSCVFTNVINPRAFINRKNEYRKTLVKEGASIGANSTIICGNDIGKYSLIGAGAIITKDVLDFSIVYGSPAEKKGWVSTYGKKLGSDLVCPVTKEVFYEKEGILYKK
tara:strand:- start:5 stop:559 length:555 start_codon:yes stop_codon:yes gene_type:complete